jgi:hypothetical protein
VNPVKVMIEIDESLLAEVQALATQEAVELSALIEKALRDRLALRAGVTAPMAGRPVPALPVCSGKGGMYPWIDPCSNESMLDAMDDYP